MADPDPETQEGITESHIYRYFRSFFSEKARCHYRKRRTIEKTLEEPEIKPSVDEFCTKYGLQPDTLAGTLRVLLAERVFEDLGQAKKRFPKMFQQSADQMNMREKWDSEAAKSEAALIAEWAEEEAEFQDPISPVEQKKPSIFDPPPSVVSHQTEANCMGDVPTNKLATVYKNGDIAILLPKQPPRLISPEDRIKTKIPNIFPIYLPYHVQHTILTEAQSILEESCYYFVKRWLPKKVTEQQYRHPKNAELNMWIRLIGKKLKGGLIPTEAYSGEIPALGKKSLKTIEGLRHTVVHRLNTHSKGLENMLDHAVSFANFLQDNLRAVQLQKLLDLVRDRSALLESMGVYLSNELEKELTEIEEARQALLEREKKAINKMIKDNEKACQDITLHPVTIWETLGVSDIRMYGLDYANGPKDAAGTKAPVANVPSLSRDQEHDESASVEDTLEDGPRFEPNNTTSSPVTHKQKYDAAFLTGDKMDAEERPSKRVAMDVGPPQQAVIATSDESERGISSRILGIYTGDIE
ncbi:U4/U6-U5 snRNP complex subunit dib1 [Arthrobotrys megalospora]